MLEWLQAASAWMQGWLSPEAGLAGVFASALLSATVLPGSTELVLSAKIVAFPALTWFAFGVALAGSAIGCALNFGMGQAAQRVGAFQAPRGGRGAFARGTAAPLRAAGAGAVGRAAGR
jgi:membrane protein YqaA with SNARE-associated domain